MNKILSLGILAFGLSIAFSSCQSGNSTIFEGGKPSENVALFELLPSSETGITFNNEVIENADYNHILKDVVFNGGGVAVVDINNDGLQDLFFAGNQKPDKLYLNEGNMHFKDISTDAGIYNDTWSTSVSIADVNNDGLQDIYVGKYMLDPAEKRRNMLYINNGDNTFTEQAGKFGLADAGHCTATNFFDYNNDGYLDLYIGNQPFVRRHIKYSGMESQIDQTPYTDRLFRNNGDATFTEVTVEAGIQNYNYTLSSTVSDLNNDGWLDIYVASDYEEPDFMYINNGNGTFTDAIGIALRHISNFSMGVDLADFNNDGYVDIYSADMAAADNYRTKANMSGMNPERFWELANAGYHYQYMFNMLHVSNGNGTWSEIGQMAGVSNTDWSWASLFADYDNDGDKDLLVTNGLVKDVKNNDYAIRRNAVMDSMRLEMLAAGVENPQIDAMDLIHMAPSVKLHNYIYSNNGDLTFNDQVDNWGLDEETWSHGAVYVDLDNDGDQDLVISNMNDMAHVYANRAVENELNNFLRISLEGDHGSNSLSYGARAWVFNGDDVQFLELSPTRGYMSSCEPVLHFGMGANQKADRVVVRWLDGRMIELTDVVVNQELELSQADGTPNGTSPLATPDQLFKDYSNQVGIDFVHQENEFDDYDREVLIPHRMSTLGPCIGNADVNGDGLEDVFVGGAAGFNGMLYLQQSNGNFQASASAPWNAHSGSEDLNILFFDAEGDGDNDMYVVSGGNEFPAGDPRYQDRVYLNDGAGNFSYANVLPVMRESGGVAAAGDLDGDGDADLFIGGRQVPGQYGFAPQSYVLRNEGGRFVDVTEDLAPDLSTVGMVSDAKWLDLDGDSDQDLILSGEWMPITFCINDDGALSNATESMGMSNTSGWWNRMELADMDGDGDMDIIAGNLGYNIKFKASEEEPFKLYVNDFDENGTHDVYLGYYDTDGICYPVRGRTCSSQQMPYIKKEFKTYDEFATTPLLDVLGSRVEGATELEVQEFATVMIENQGGGKFAIKELPSEAQTSPAFGIVCRDFNQDGNMDILLSGNYYEREVETCRSDAGTGCLLINDGNGNFKAMHPAETGIAAIGDARDMTIVDRGDNNPLVLIANNRSFIQVYELQDKSI